MGQQPACPPLTFVNVTTAQFNSIASAVATHWGIQVKGPTGTASARGYTVTWNFVSSQGTLTVQCLATPNPTALFGGLASIAIMAIASQYGLTKLGSASSAAPAVSIAQRSFQAIKLALGGTGPISAGPAPSAAPKAVQPACPALVFGNVTMAKFSSLVSAVGAKWGIQVIGWTGTDSACGYTVSWNFAPSQNTLTIQCLAVPNQAGILAGLVNMEITALATQCGLTKLGSASSAAPAVSPAQNAFPLMRLGLGGPGRAFAGSAPSAGPAASAGPAPSSASPAAQPACPALVFGNVTTAKFNSLCSAVSTHWGVQVSGWTGTFSAQGYTVTWNFVPPQNSLTIQCLAAPNPPAVFGGLVNIEIVALASQCGLTKLSSAPSAASTGSAARTVPAPPSSVQPVRWGLGR